MPRVAIFVLLAGAAFPAHADWFYRFVGYTCDRAGDRLVIHYRGAYNEAGEAMREAKGHSEWEPDDFIASMKDEDHIGRLRTVSRDCRLKHGHYRIRLGATPGNYNIQGRCGGVVTAWVEVRRGAERVLPRHELEGDCHDSAAPVTTQIEFVEGKAPAFRTVTPDEFMR